MSKITGPLAELLAEDMSHVFEQMGYAFFKKGDYNLNIIGIRSRSGSAQTFDDNMLVVYKVKSKWCVECYEITTEPGTRILKRPLKEVAHKGTAILVPDQYRGVYQIGWHGSKSKGHVALCQRGGKVKVWRDNNRDEKPDYHGPADEGWYGINIHRHRGSSAQINTNGVSAGCQVFRSNTDFNAFMKTCESAKKKWGNNFTYTLLTQSEVEDNL